MLKKVDIFAQPYNSFYHPIDSDECATLLIVEDNNDVKKYLNVGLENKYHIIFAENGKQGLKYTVKYLPDLILTKMTMMEMNGLEFIKRVKTGLLTCHIPIIILAENGDIRYRIECYKNGADGYISKPLNLSLLKVRIHNLLESRRILREKFSHESEIESKISFSNSKDTQLLDRAKKIVEEHLHDFNFSVDLFSKELGLSRSQLFRKLKSKLSETPNKFIQKIRLKHAAELLKNTDFSITEICYETGFNYPSHFTQLFKERFGITPKNYRKKYLKK